MSADPRHGEPVVLYVDDEPVNLRVFEANFRHHFRVQVATDGAEALNKARTLGADLAVVISDQRMPAMSGVELLERIRELAPDTVRMLITAYSDMQAVVDAVNRGQVSRYFVKPWMKDELLTALQDALRIFTLQRKLHEFELRMMRSERLAVLGELSAGIAHELLNPVAYIGQNVDLLRSELGTITQYTSTSLSKTPNEQVSHSLEEVPGILGDIELGAKHLRAVGDKLKAQSRGDGSSSCDVYDVAHFADKISRPEVRKRARIVVTGEPVKVAIPEVNLTQVLLNLLVNAGHALEDVDRAGRIELRWRTEGARVVVEVEDNGSGIEPANLERIFDPAFSTKPAGKGTGLGLPTVRGLLKAANGDIAVKSTPGEGTVFTVTLPKVG